MSVGERGGQLLVGGSVHVWVEGQQQGQLLALRKGELVCSVRAHVFGTSWKQPEGVARR